MAPQEGAPETLDVHINKLENEVEPIMHKYLGQEITIQELQNQNQKLCQHVAQLEAMAKSNDLEIPANPHPVDGSNMYGNRSEGVSPNSNKLPDIGGGLSSEVR